MTDTPQTITRTTRSERDTEQLAASIARQLRPGDCLALRGDLGAGKTRFVRGLAEGLGINPSLVTSPTYVLMQEYDTAPQTGVTLIHIDAYRLPPGEDLASLGIDAASLTDSILVVEWAERVADALPADRFDIAIAHHDGDRRIITITPPRARVIALDPPASFRCRSCGKSIAPDAPYFPFCSDRCRMADLNKWFSGDYTISREIKDADLDALE